MYVSYDPDAFETISEYRRCAFHETFPGEYRAGCTCSFIMTQRRRTDAEISAIRAERRRKEEDRILAEAEIIRARRAS